MKRLRTLLLLSAFSLAARAGTGHAGTPVALGGPPAPLDRAGYGAAYALGTAGLVRAIARSSARAASPPTPYTPPAPRKDAHDGPPTPLDLVGVEFGRIPLTPSDASADGEPPLIAIASLEAGAVRLLPIGSTALAEAAGLFRQAADEAGPRDPANKAADRFTPTEQPTGAAAAALEVLFSASPSAWAVAGAPDGPADVALSFPRDQPAPLLPDDRRGARDHVPAGLVQRPYPEPFEAPHLAAERVGWSDTDPAAGAMAAGTSLPVFGWLDTSIGHATPAAEAAAPTSIAAAPVVLSNGALGASDDRPEADAAVFLAAEPVDLGEASLTGGARRPAREALFLRAEPVDLSDAALTGGAPHAQATLASAQASAAASAGDLAQAGAARIAYGADDAALFGDAMVTGGQMASDEALFASAQTERISDTELDEQRGGFIFQGLEIRLGAEFRSYIGDELVIQTNFNFADAEAQVQRVISTQLTPGVLEQVQTGILNGSGLNLRASDNTVYLTNDGQTAFIQRSDGALQNIIINSANNVALRQEIEAQLDVSNFAPFQSLVLNERITSALSDMIAAGLMSGVGR